jgi:hypothetical protein
MKFHTLTSGGESTKLICVTAITTVLLLALPIGLAAQGTQAAGNQGFGQSSASDRSCEGRKLPNANQLALLRWYSANVSASFQVGGHPIGMAFDGANLWVVNTGFYFVSKLRASDGAVLGTFPVGKYPGYAAFDGANIWVTNLGDNTVSKLRASDGASLGTFPTGTAPWGIAFAGTSVWVGNILDLTSPLIGLLAHVVSVDGRPREGSAQAFCQHTVIILPSRSVEVSPRSRQCRGAEPEASPSRTTFCRGSGSSRYCESSCERKSTEHWFSYRFPNFCQWMQLSDCIGKLFPNCSGVLEDSTHHDDVNGFIRGPESMGRRIRHFREFCCGLPQHRGGYQVALIGRFDHRSA